MGYRLSKIYTKTGDQGETALGDGTRVPKTHPRVEAYGGVDELNSWVGLLLSYDLPNEIGTIFTRIQHTLFDLGGELCIPNSVAIEEEDVLQLERVLDDLNSDLKPLKEFILPGGSAAAATCQVSRAVCRRAERRVVQLAQTESVNPVSIQYLNRLSDLLFVVARSLNRTAGLPDQLWEPGRK